MISSQCLKQKCKTNCKGAVAHELFKYRDSFGAAPCFQQEKPKIMPAKHNMQHVSILRKSVSLHRNSKPKISTLHVST